MLRLPPFRYLRPRTERDAVAIAAAEPRARFVAGGTDLYPNMKRLVEEPPVVVGLSRLTALAGVEPDAGGDTRIGAMTTLTRLAAHPHVKLAHPWVAKAASLISTPLLRNMGTIGGNLLLDTRCNYYDQSYEWRRAIDFCMKKDGSVCWVAPGSPRCWAVQSSDLAPLLCAIGALVRLVSEQDGERTIDMDALYQNDGIRYLTKRPDELLTSVWLPRPNGSRAVYYKVRRRGSFDFPVLGVAAWVRFEGDAYAPDARVAEARIRLGGVGSYPVPADDAAAALIGRVLDEDAIREVAERAARPARPLDNTDYAMTWRKKVTRIYVARALRALARGEAGGSSDHLDGAFASGQTLPMA